jgi:hypothetical protein
MADLSGLQELSTLGLYKNRAKLSLLLITLGLLLYFQFQSKFFAHTFVYLVYAGGVIAFYLYDQRYQVNLLVNFGVYSITILAGYATLTGLWSEIPHFDNFIHFSILLLVGFMAFHLWNRVTTRMDLVYFASIGTVVLFGWVIEAVEFILWGLFELNMAPVGEFYADTMEDFIFDVVGGLIGIFIGMIRKGITKD